jgi:hypothetical protein
MDGRETCFYIPNLTCLTLGYGKEQARISGNRNAERQLVVKSKRVAEW